VCLKERFIKTWHEKLIPHLTTYIFVVLYRMEYLRARGQYLVNAHPNLRVKWCIEGVGGYKVLYSIYTNNYMKRFTRLKRKPLAGKVK